MKTGREFTAQIEEFVRETEARIIAVHRESAQRIVSKAQEYISGELVNVQTGFLRASLRVSLSEMPKIDPGARPNEGQRYTPESDVSLIIGSWNLKETMYAGYTAAYARHVHDGTSKMAGRPWVELAAMQWPQTVSEVTQELKRRLGA